MSRTPSSHHTREAIIAAARQLPASDRTYKAVGQIANISHHTVRAYFSSDELARIKGEHDVKFEAVPWGDGTPGSQHLNIVCSEWGLVIASDIPGNIAKEIVRRWNACNARSNS